MKFKINSYFAVLCLAVAGIGAALLIFHVATSNKLSGTVNGSEARYAPLQWDILSH